MFPVRAENRAILPFLWRNPIRTDRIRPATLGAPCPAWRYPRSTLLRALRLVGVARPVARRRRLGGRQPAIPFLRGTPDLRGNPAGVHGGMHFRRSTPSLSPTSISPAWLPALPGPLPGLVCASTGLMSWRCVVRSSPVVLASAPYRSRQVQLPSLCLHDHSMEIAAGRRAEMCLRLCRHDADRNCCLFPAHRQTCLAPKRF